MASQEPDHLCTVCGVPVTAGRHLWPPDEPVQPVTPCAVCGSVKNTAYFVVYNRTYCRHHYAEAKAFVDAQMMHNHGEGILWTRNCKACPDTPPEPPGPLH
jgi:hypothetical protein